MANDYAEKILQAADIISKAATNNLEYDKTIIVKITDNSFASRGQYTVSDGDAAFLAYTDNQTYDVGEYVYVTVPGGDFARQKIIVGKYLGNNSSSYYTYSSPWKKFIDVSGDMINDDKIENNSILANGDIEEVLIWKSNNIESGDGYTNVGLQASFKTTLQSLGTAFGHFGLNLYVTFMNEGTIGGQKGYGSVKFELNNMDMYGNPYNFDTYYKQNKVFDISGLGVITGLRLTLFQRKDFTKTNNEPIPFTTTNSYITYDENGQPHTNITTTLLDDNIFIKDVYVALGYNLDDFNKDVVLLYTNDSKTYAIDSSNEENAKELSIRWIHKDDASGKITCYNSSESIMNVASVHWYKYNQSRGINDKWAGNFWEEMPREKNNFSILVQPNLTKPEEHYKVIIETPLYDDLILEAAQTEEEVEIAKEELDRYQKVYNDAADEFINLQSDTNYRKYIQAKNNYERQQEIFDSIAASYVADLKIYESNILTLTNENPMANADTVDLIQGLSIICDKEGYNGIYYLYDSSNNIVNKADINVRRILSAEYNSINAGDNILDTAEKITWQIPTSNTMIEMPKRGIEYTEEDEFVQLDNGYCQISRTVAATGTITLGGYTGINSQQVFRIKEYYSSSATNNIVSCIVSKNGINYQASYELSFGPTGTNGTDYTFMIKMPPERHCLYADNIDTLEITASLLDRNNLYVDLSDAIITYDWYSKDKESTVAFCDINGKILTGDTFQGHDKCYIRLLKNRIPYYNILHAQIRQNDITSSGEKIGTVILDAYLPIPFSINPKRYNYIHGDDRIIYNTSGTCEYYYNNDYEVYNSNDQKQDAIVWTIQADNSTDKNFIPSITESGRLIPTSSFIENINKRLALIAYDKNFQQIAWIQPLLIYKDVYTSALLNSWDGSLTIDEENGTIMSTMMGAGYKDSQNRYNGVLIGDVKSAADGYAGVGVYGYNTGEQSFGLNVDGTAFFGKAGRGRIEMDGNSGRIKSSSYETNSSGMLVDLDDGYIDIRGARFEVIENKIDDSGTISTKSFKDKCEDLKIQYQKLKENSEAIMVNAWQQYTNTSEKTYNDAKKNSDRYAGIIRILDEAIKYLDGDIYKLASQFDKDEIYYEDENGSSEGKKRSESEFQHGKYYYIKKNPTYDELLTNQEIVKMAAEENIILQEIFTSSEVISDDQYKYSPTYSQVWISATSPYLSVKSATSNHRELLRISDEAYFLQSDTFEPTTWNYDKDKEEWIIDTNNPGKGFKFDLIDGKLDLHDFRISNVHTADDRYRGSYFMLTTDGVVDPYFVVHYQDNFTTVTTEDDISNDLIKISVKDFFLHSSNWKAPENENNISKGRGLSLDLTKGTLSAFDGFNLYGYNRGTIWNSNTGTYDPINDENIEPHIGSYIQLSSSGDPYFKVHYKYAPKSWKNNQIYFKKEDNSNVYVGITEIDTDLINISNNNFFLQSSQYGLIEKMTDGGYVPQGTKIDLQNGDITSYSFNLNAFTSDGSEISLQSKNKDDDNPPFSIISSSSYQSYNENQTSVNKTRIKSYQFTQNQICYWIKNGNRTIACSVNIQSTINLYNNNTENCTRQDIWTYGIGNMAENSSVENISQIASFRRTVPYSFVSLNPTKSFNENYYYGFIIVKQVANSGEADFPENTQDTKFNDTLKYKIIFKAFDVPVGCCDLSDLTFYGIKISESSQDSIPIHIYFYTDSEHQNIQLYNSEKNIPINRQEIKISSVGNNLSLDKEFFKSIFIRDPENTVELDIYGNIINPTNEGPSSVYQAWNNLMTPVEGESAQISGLQRYKNNYNNNVITPIYKYSANGKEINEIILEEITVSTTTLTLGNSETGNPPQSTKIYWNGRIETNALQATDGGLIGPFSIRNTSLATGSTAFGQTGIYLGTEGRFSVMSTTGNHTAGIKIENGNMIITGDIYLGGTIYGENWTLHGYYTTVGGGGGGSGTSSPGHSGNGSNLKGWAFSEATISKGSMVIGADGYINTKAGEFETGLRTKTAEITHNLYALGETFLQQTTVSGSLTAGSSLSVAGELTADSTLTVEGTLTANASITVKPSLSVTGTLSVTQMLTASGGLTASGTVSLPRDTKFGGTSLGDLAFNDRVEISATFKLGDTTLSASGTPGSIAVYTVALPNNKKYTVAVTGTEQPSASGTTYYRSTDGLATVSGSASKTVYCYVPNAATVSTILVLPEGQSAPSTYRQVGGAHTVTVSYSNSVPVTIIDTSNYATITSDDSSIQATITATAVRTGSGGGGSGGSGGGNGDYS